MPARHTYHAATVCRPAECMRFVLPLLQIQRRLLQVTRQMSTPAVGAGDRPSLIYDKEWIKNHFEECQEELDKYSHSHLYKEEIISLSGGIKAGDHVVDVGCGGRGLSILAAERGAHITATDGTAAAIKMVKQRLEPYKNWEAIQTPQEKLKLPDDKYDHVFSLLSAFLSPEYETAMQELKRVAKPGATVTTQGAADINGMGWMPAVTRAIVRLGKQEPIFPESFKVFCDPEKTRALFEKTGLEDVKITKVTRDWIGPDEAGWRGKTGAILLGMNPLYSELPTDQKDPFLALFLDVLKEDYSTDEKGRTVIPDPTWVAVGRKKA